MAIAPIGPAELYAPADDPVTTMKTTITVATAVLLLMWPGAAAGYGEAPPLDMDAVEPCQGQVPCLLQAIIDAITIFAMWLIGQGVEVLTILIELLGPVIDTALKLLAALEETCDEAFGGCPPPIE